jgi:predicted RecB family nuclease
MVERLLTPSKITAWLECSHFLSLRNQVDAGSLSIAPAARGSLADLLVEKGAQHERDCLADLENQGKSVYHVPGRNPGESFDAWVTRIGNPLQGDYDVIFQMPFVHEGIRGIADFLVRVDEPDEHFALYEPIDAKLARAEGKPGHVLQLCFYADAIAALSGRAPRSIHLWLGTGVQETLVVEQFGPYWRRLRQQLRALLEEEVDFDTVPVPCDHCEYCEFSDRCQNEWRSQDALVYVANIRANQQEALEDAGVRTVVELSRRSEPVASLHEENLSRLVRQASLQVASRERPENSPVFEIVEPSDDPVYGHGFEQLPAPDDGDVFFDFEGHPFWTPKQDLFFLAGLYYRDDTGAWSYDERWAHSIEEQSRMIRELVEFMAKRREAYPHMHVYHYNHTERSALERLTSGTESEILLSSLVTTGLFVDLFVVAKNAVVVGTESYGLKYLERLANFERTGGIEQGAGAVVEYEEFMKTGDPAILKAIAAYNRDDVAATLALREWLVSQRPEDLEWRDAVLDDELPEYDTDELVAKLDLYEEGSPERLLGALLNYWRRERSANITPKIAEIASDFATLYANGDFIANARFERFEEGESKGVSVKNAVFSWPTQVVGPLFKNQMSVLYAGLGGEHGFGYVARIDAERRELHLRWRDREQEADIMPVVFTPDDYVHPREKPGVLVHLAEQILAPNELDPPSRVSMALLARQRPRFAPGKGPRDGVFRHDLDDILTWVGDLDESYVALQGPPGTGKTYSGSHIIHELIRSGKRVGITAMSHAAIDNLLAATLDVFEEKGDRELVRVLRKGEKPKVGALDGVTYTSSNARAESEAFNLVAGTTWLWARAGLRPYPVDYLVIDEAGQLALADAIASANAARNLILLGDPLQLAQVAQADHPGGSGASVLEHVLGGHPTVPVTDGVFIAETRRMHPGVCSFISNQIYEGRLTSHEHCSRQDTQFGTGLRWIEVHHENCATESLDEVQVVAEQITRMIGSTWTNQDGLDAPLEASDFMVVAPYNDQVRLLQNTFQKSRVLAGVQVGTVDKFQGREAPVVFFTMTTSSAKDMPRGPEFLFSRNRLNVAISRARCLAYLVCTEALLNSRARTIDEMRLIGTLSAFVEYAKE